MTDKYRIDYDISRTIGSHTVYRIVATSDFWLNAHRFSYEVKKGNVGGWVESGANLSQLDSAWIDMRAAAYGNARVTDGAVVFATAEISDNAVVSEGATVSGSSRVYENALVSESARVEGNCAIYGNARVVGESRVDHSEICDKALISGSARVHSSVIGGSAWICGTATLNNQQIFSGIEDGKELEFDEYEDTYEE
jgi:NDP-sugar pyrophosphorylase family protein